jgi:hypothetical protein
MSTFGERKHTTSETEEAEAAFDPEREQITIAPLFNPREDSWDTHFSIRITTESILIVGRTPVGRATVVRLGMNDEHAVRARLLWVLADLFPP